ncbi:hypothetical protein SDRG_12647 [Saprolegnia diclina VS20]|uniref:Calponin-homology (CH) domain-containing protein n=1 Tax=Saprolegnia diclina (strain VS20) TaxID=1156394 RepID=T0RBS1_SAPDV|nr:hypothetical protein SDRG_12647 [Saprolegnia diclina VS20]EQC29643.1 hypothetical protein SDRG_12647 [Saprolegnia diclina VS20]|eukprot:XP_008616947.1 hypothetical protein SDRG_12647 [Saprolegnia diclina VS20]
MSELLLRWLNDEVQLSVVVTEFEATFASGYLLGEVLFKANQQHNFGDFVSSDSADAKIVNFCLLEPSMRALGIRMDPVIATSVMNEASGAATKLLYQLKTAIARAHRSGTVSCRPYAPGGVLPIHNVPGRLPKTVFDPIKHESFEHAIRLHVKAQDELKREKYLGPRTYKVAAAAQLTLDRVAQKAAYHEHLEATRQQRLHLTKIQREFTQITTEGETEAWAAATAKKRERERRKARYKKLVATRAAERQATALATAKDQVTNGIATFEATLTETKTLKPSKGLQLPTQLSIGYGIRSLRTTFKNVDVTVPTSPTPMPSVGAKRRQRELRGDIQRKRRARFLKACDNHQRARNDDVVQAALEATLLRATTTEVHLETKEANVVAYMDIVTENRARRNAQYAQRAETDVVESARRDATAYGMLHHRFTDAVQAQCERAERLTTAMAAAAAETNIAIAHHVLDRVVDLALATATYRETSTWILPSDVFVPPPTWQEMLAFGVHAPDELFAAGFASSDAESVLNACEIERHVTSTRHALVTESRLESDATLPAPSFVYGKLPREHVLGEVVAACRARTTSPTLAPPRVPFPAFALKLALLGKPFAGRKTCAALLATQYNLAPVSVHALLETAMATKSDVGVVAKDLLSAGQSIPNALYLTLLERAIRSIDPSEKRGWILTDFVASLDEAMDLERVLSGHVPAPTPTPTRSDHLAVPLPPPALPLNHYLGKSGLDLVFRLEVDRTKVFRHCLGKLMDPVTGARFHMQDAPPTEADARSRLCPWRDPTIATEALSLFSHAYDVAMPSLLAWFAPYGTLRTVSGDDLVGAMSDYIDAFLHGAAATESANCLEMEARANDAMAAEEGRQGAVARHDETLRLALESEAAAAQTLRAGEDAKLKKDELVALRVGVEAAHQSVLEATQAAHAFLLADRHGDSANLPLHFSVVPEVDLAALGCGVWEASDSQYKRTLEHGFSMLRAYRSRVEAHAVNVLSEMTAFARRPDAKQGMLDAFQYDFNNSVLDDMRFDASTKAELHVRVDTLLDQLGAVLDAKGAEALALLETLLRDQWKEDALTSIQLVGTMLFQAEVDLFHASVTVITDAVAGFEVGLVKSLDDGKIPLLPLGKDPAEDEKEAVVAPTKASAAAKKKVVVEAEVVPLTPAQEVAAAFQKAKDTLAIVASKALKLPNVPGTATPSGASTAPPPTTKKEKEAGTATPVAKKDTIASSNAIAGVGFEYDYVLSRLAALQDRVLDTMGYVDLVLTSLETDLRAFVSSRLGYEKDAMLSLVKCIRDAIEHDESLPFRLLLEPRPTARTPPLRQEVLDVQARIDSSVRVIAKPSVPLYPSVEHWDDMYLNTRQLNGVMAMLRELATATLGHSVEFVPRATLNEGFARLASRPTTTLPRAWRRRLSKLGAYFDTKHSGLVKAFPDVAKVLQAKHRVDEMVLHL